MNQWLNPRIWRSPRANFYRDEPLEVLDVYADDELRAIHEAGFDAIWVRGRLYDLMESAVFPQLNRPQAATRRRNLQELIARAGRHGIGLWLYFNDPLAVPAADPFWTDHADLQGTPHVEFGINQEVRALCTSTPAVQEFLREALTGLFRELRGLDGVYLITASEYHSHCWSRHALIPIGDDPYTRKAPGELPCPRCRGRGPSAVVIELLQLWRDAARAAGAPAPRVIASNWSWSMWYPDPQTEIVSQLPAGVELLGDWERGGARPWRDRTILVDEYSLAFPGPSPRFAGAAAVARQQGRLIHAKFQLGTTHELATVPNLPLIADLHAKFVGLYREQVAGIKACWNFGCSRTLNTHALATFAADPARWLDAAEFLPHAARTYFGAVDTGKVVTAWRLFGEAFRHYPFCIPMLYHSPFNYAPAFPLGRLYHARPLGPSWLEHAPWGDRLDDCLSGWSLAEVTDSIEKLRDTWQRGLELYRQALDDRQNVHCREELSCAEMIGCHSVSFANILRFHQWRLRALNRQGLTPPCTLELDDDAREILRAELPNVRAAAELCRQDARLGFHEECQAHLFDVPALERKIRELEADVAGS